MQQQIVIEKFILNHDVKPKFQTLWVYHKNAEVFREATIKFFQGIGDRKKELVTLLDEGFQGF
ncbi:MAG: hypothetical protein P8077_04740 [Gammaproteobacteria bacterium]